MASSYPRATLDSDFKDVVEITIDRILEEGFNEHKYSLRMKIRNIFLKKINNHLSNIVRGVIDESKDEIENLYDKVAEDLTSEYFKKSQKKIRKYVNDISQSRVQAALAEFEPIIEGMVDDAWKDITNLPKSSVADTDTEDVSDDE